jgi:hypothetical protein
MEMTQENSLCNYLKQKISFFSFTKSENSRAEEVLPGGVGIRGRGEKLGNVCSRVNIVQILCTHVCKQKNDTC